MENKHREQVLPTQALQTEIKGTDESISGIEVMVQEINKLVQENAKNKRVLKKQENWNTWKEQT